jgi:hypothetical protein
MGPRLKYPRKAVLDVLTPVMVRTPLGISSIYTPGYEYVDGIGFLLGYVADRLMYSMGQENFPD